MNIKERAKKFAIKAHLGQIRKSEPDKPMIMHPISVGMILEEYGYDDNVIAAGYLHDVVEDTKYTFEDIKEEFGEDVANLVYGASEPDKSLSWEERKQHTIDTIKTMSLRNKLIVCADKISNLSDLDMIFRRSGKRDFSAFKRGEESQAWYYKNIYESLIYNEDETLPIFKRLKNVLDSVFAPKENEFLNEIFKDNKEYYSELKKLAARKEELNTLKKLVSLDKPFVIEFTGTPRTGKTTTLKNLSDFFKKGGFKIKEIEEFTTSKLFKEYWKPILDEMSLEDSNLKILVESTKQLEDATKENDADIILVDRSINDRQIWHYRRFVRGDIPEDRYIKTRDEFIEKSKNLIDFLVITYANPMETLKRDYISSLALEQRRFIKVENIEEYNVCMNKIRDVFEKSVSDYLDVDTTNITVNDTAIKVADSAMKCMREKYIEAFKLKYEI